VNSRNPKFWALIGFGIGAVVAAGGGVTGPLDSIFGGIIQAAIWFGVSSLILQKRNKQKILNAQSIKTPVKQAPVIPGFSQESSEEALARMFNLTDSSIQDSSEEFKNCPMCAEQIRFAAKKCRFCQHMLST
jgi:hypothetical protein